MTDSSAGKKAAALAALRFVDDDAIIGVGTGSTVNFFIDALAGRRDRIRGAVSSSEASTARLKAAGIEVLDLNRTGDLEVYVDGADETDHHRRLIKGGGAALFREKVLAAASQRLVIVIDATKRVPRLGATRPIPVEVLPFAVGSCLRLLGQIGGDALRRLDESGAPVVTDNGNHVLDVAFDASRMVDPRALDEAMRAIPGIIITGLFWSFNPTVVVGTDTGVEVVGPAL